MAVQGDIRQIGKPGAAMRSLSPLSMIFTFLFWLEISLAATLFGTKTLLGWSDAANSALILELMSIKAIGQIVSAVWYQRAARNLVGLAKISPIFPLLCWAFIGGPVLAFTMEISRLGYLGGLTRTTAFYWVGTVLVLGSTLLLPVLLWHLQVKSLQLFHDRRALRVAAFAIGYWFFNSLAITISSKAGFYWRPGGPLESIALAAIASWMLKNIVHDVSVSQERFARHTGVALTDVEAISAETRPLFFTQRKQLAIIVVAVALGWATLADLSIIRGWVSGN